MWEVRVQHGMIRPCSYGGGNVFWTLNNGPCGCGVGCAMRVMDDASLSGHSVTNVDILPNGCYDAMLQANILDRYEYGCDVCPPTAGVNTSAPGGLSTFRVEGCRHLGGRLCNNQTPNNCAINQYPNCCLTVGNNNFYTYDDVADGLLGISGIQTCVRKPLGYNQLDCGWYGVDPANLNMHSRIIVTFGTEEVLYRVRNLSCIEQAQGNFDWECYYEPSNGYYSIPGMQWVCEYVREHKPCDWFATGSYRLVRVNATPCYATSYRLTGNNCDGCGIPNGLSTCLANWNGIDAGNLATSWKPPNTITVARLR